MTTPPTTSLVSAVEGKVNPYLIQGQALISFSEGRTSGYMLKHILDAHGGTGSRGDPSSPLPSPSSEQHERMKP
jgi:hypothetical protein